MLPSDDMLGLNIVVEDKGGVAASTATNIGKIRKPKKNNKYEKRRAKARRAKLLKENGLNHSSEKETNKEPVDNEKEEVDGIVTASSDVNKEISESRHPIKNNKGESDEMNQGARSDALVSNNPPVSSFQRDISNSMIGFDAETSRKQQQIKTEQLLQKRK